MDGIVYGTVLISCNSNQFFSPFDNVSIFLFFFKKKARQKDIFISDLNLLGKANLARINKMYNCSFSEQPSLNHVFRKLFLGTSAYNHKVCCMCYEMWAEKIIIGDH